MKKSKIINQLRSSYDKVIQSVNDKNQKSILIAMKIISLKKNKNRCINESDLLIKWIGTYEISEFLNKKTSNIRYQLNKMEKSEIVQCKRDSNHINWWVKDIEGFKPKYDMYLEFIN